MSVLEPGWLKKSFDDAKANLTVDKELAALKPLLMAKLKVKGQSATPYLDKHQAKIEWKKDFQYMCWCWVFVCTTKLHSISCRVNCHKGESFPSNATMVQVREIFEQKLKAAITAKEGPADMKPVMAAKFLTQAKKNAAAGLIPFGTTVLYTDGGCNLTEKRGSWAWYAYRDGSPIGTKAGCRYETTNNRMEMTAVIRALSELEIGPPIRLRADSQYVLTGMQVWVHGWKKHGWFTAAGLPVKNQDLWEELHALASLHNLSYEHVKGHAGEPGNTLVDKLCTEAMAAMPDGAGVHSDWIFAS